MTASAQEAQLLQDLLGKKAPGKFTAAELAGKAHWRWNREQYLEAAVLFDAAAVLSAQEIQRAPQDRDNTFNYRVRSGVTFRLAGHIQRAWPMLLEATTFDWDAAGIPEDSHFTEWAFVEMLIVVAQAQDRAGFAKLFWQAVARCNEIDSPFPRIHPKQELLLDLCSQLDLRKELAHVVASIERRGSWPRPLARRLKQLKQDLAQRGRPLQPAMRHSRTYFSQALLIIPADEAAFLMRRASTLSDFTLK